MVVNICDKHPEGEGGVIYKHDVSGEVEASQRGQTQMMPVQRRRPAAAALAENTSLGLG